MEILRFTLGGKQAFFKKPEVNSYYYFTYGHIHKVALLGIFGAILGYSGYNQMKKEDEYPEFYRRLKDIKISIVPLAKKGNFSKKIISFNNSVGYASREQGGNLIIKEQWIENPSWDIYVLLDNEESKKLADSILNRKCVYTPYLGKNDHPADISNIEIVKGTLLEKAEHINSFFTKGEAMVDIDDYEQISPFKYEETLPVEIDEKMNMYVMKRFVLSNMIVTDCKCNVYKVLDSNCLLEDKKVNLVFN